MGKNLTLRPINLGKIKLREVSIDDLDDLFKIGSKDIVCRYLNWGPYKTKHEAFYTIVEIFLKRPLDNIPVGYSIIVDNKMVGMIDLHTFNENENSMEIGYFLDNDYWGKGIMTKSMNALLDVAFNDLELDRVNIGSIIDNIRSINLIERFKFNYYETRIANIDDIAYKVKCYYLLKSDYLERKL